MKKPAKAPTHHQTAAAVAKRRAAAKKGAATRKKNARKNAAKKQALPSVNAVTSLSNAPGSLAWVGSQNALTAAIAAKNAKTKKTAAQKKRSAAAKKGAITRKKKAALGGQCAWDAFGLPKPWYRRGAQPVHKVAKCAGFVAGDLRPGAVVGLTVSYAGKTGYHAAQVTQVRRWDCTIDLWGEPYVAWLDEVQECFVRA